MEKVKLSLFADDMKLYLENTKDATQDLLQPIDSIKFQDTKSMHRSQLHFYTLIINYQRDFWKTIPLINASKRIRYIQINLTKEVRGIYTENCKISMKETEDTNKWKDIQCSWIGRVLLNCPCYPKWSTYSMQFLWKYQLHFLQKWKKQS